MPSGHPGPSRPVKQARRVRSRSPGEAPLRCRCTPPDRRGSRSDPTSSVASGPCPRSDRYRGWQEWRWRWSSRSAQDRRGRRHTPAGCERRRPEAELPAPVPVFSSWGAKIGHGPVPTVHGLASTRLAPMMVPGAAISGDVIGPRGHRDPSSRVRLSTPLDRKLSTRKPEMVARLRRDAASSPSSSGTQGTGSTDARNSRIAGR